MQTNLWVAKSYVSINSIILMYKYIHLICIDEYIHIFHNSSITSSKIPSQGLHPCELYVQAVFQIHLVGRCNQFQIMCLKYLLWSVHTPSRKFNHFYTAACSTSCFTVTIFKTYANGKINVVTKCGWSAPYMVWWDTVQFIQPFSFLWE